MKIELEMFLVMFCRLFNRSEEVILVVDGGVFVVLFLYGG